MNKQELIASMTEKTGLSKKDTEASLAAFIETVEETLSKGDKIQLVGFGSFEIRDRAARTGKNPLTGEEMNIPAAKVPAFKPGKALKEKVNK
ncbi:MAG TPA: HU family DNA-binding protein [Firmicutes bacterium]|nr:HU family DNA-binding protein [Bacillota bacterium]